MADPRIPPVEDNLLSFMAAMVALPPLVREPWDDVHAAHSEIAFPLFNPVFGARFEPGSETRRTREVVAAYVARGLPFLWWITPSTTSPELEAVLTGAGLHREDIPGMHAALEGPAARLLPRGVELTEVAVQDEVEPYLTTFFEGFGIPSELHDAWAGMLLAFEAPGMVSVLATVDGLPAATGTAWLTGSTVGLYNITTLPHFRGRGVGHAVTTRLMDLGAERGAAEAVLHASDVGRPLYERLGFVEVCQVPQYAWLPGS